MMLFISVTSINITVMMSETCIMEWMPSRSVPSADILVVCAGPKGFPRVHNQGPQGFEAAEPAFDVRESTSGARPSFAYLALMLEQSALQLKLADLQQALVQLGLD